TTASAMAPTKMTARAPPAQELWIPATIAPATTTPAMKTTVRTHPGTDTSAPSCFLGVEVPGAPTLVRSSGAATGDIGGGTEPGDRTPGDRTPGADNPIACRSPTRDAS